MLLAIDEVSLSYRKRGGEFLALDRAGIAVGEGEAVGLVGRSGSGKSTLALVAAGLEAASSGTVTFDGVSCDARIPLRKRLREFRRAMLEMQMVFQHPAATFTYRMMVGTAVEEGVAYRGVSREERKERSLAALAQVGLPESYARKHAWELSGGECQRAAIARAIVSRPKLLICDEPTSALDATVQARIVRLIRDLCDDMGMACLFISHDLALVRGLCGRAYVMDAGRIVEEGPTSCLFDDPQAEATRRLVDAVLEI